MITKYLDSAIRCQPGAKRKLSTLFGTKGAFSVVAFSFVCRNCFARWDMTHFAGAFEPDTVTCSNCYQPTVLITKVRAQIIEPKDLA